MEGFLFMTALFLSLNLGTESFIDSKICGLVDHSRLKIVNGVPSPIHFPWFAALYTPEKSTLPQSQLSVDCGGVLVTSRHVVTAGHCYKGIPEPKRSSHFNIAFNMINRCEGPREEVKVKRVIIHGLYEENWDQIPENDAAILILMNYVSNTPICLPTQHSYNGIYGITVGFGSITSEAGNSKFPCELMSANMLINTREYCLKTNYFPDTIADRTICAHSPGYRIDPCFADSGGPLMVYSFGRFELVGILSYGKVCAGDNWPKIYTDITDLGQGHWLKEQIFGQVSKWFNPKQQNTFIQSHFHVRPL